MAEDIIITTASKANRKEYSKKHAEAFSIIFRTDPGIRFVTSSLSEDDHSVYLRQYMKALMKAALLNDSVFQEADDWSSVAVWMPPGKRIDNPFTIIQAGLVGITLKLGFGGVKKMLWDWQPRMDALKKKYLGQRDIEKYWYFFFIGTYERSRGRGIASKIIREWQQNVAVKEKLPIWLESTTETSRRVYEKCGFEVLEEVVIGKGTHSASGNEEKGGSGVPIWVMLWTPPAVREKIVT